MLTIDSGTRLGNYILEEQIGAGTFGEVWKAHHHERPGQWVAVKIAAEEHRRQLRREGRFPHIQHPNVVPIIDSDTRGEVPYVVMPLLAGNLAGLIAQHAGGLPEDRVEALLRDILAGLAAVQAGGIEAHRDVKPSNFLLDAKGRAAVSDFGLSLAALGADQAQSVYQSLSVMQSGDERTRIAGTPAYMAPEVLKGQEATAAADVYAVGALLFEMLAGRGPEGAELPSLRRKDLRRPAFWDALFYWSYRPLAERYTNAAAMLDAVNHGPKHVPFAPGPADVPPLNLPPPAPLPDELWEALAVRWEERERLSAWLAEHRGVISETLKEYAEPHRHVRGLRQQEAQIVGELKAADERLRAVCGKIVAQLEKETAPLKQRRDNLLAEGCLPNHRDVEALDRQIAPYDMLRGRVGNLPGADRSHPLAACMTEWIRVRRADNSSGYEEFLTHFGRTPNNPWAPSAQARIQRIRRRRRLRLLAGVSAVLVVLLIIFSVGIAVRRHAARQEADRLAALYEMQQEAVRREADRVAAEARAREEAAQREADRLAAEVEGALQDGNRLQAEAALAKLISQTHNDTRVSAFWTRIEAIPLPDPLVLDLGGGVKMELVLIPVGEFTMGSPAGEEGRGGDEGPQHKVRIGKAFYMGKYEVTNAQYRRFKADHDSGEYSGHSLNGDDQPVVNVSWNDADAFCKWLAGKTGRSVRLPTESEWEYAARAGDGRVFPWGNEWPPRGKAGNYADETAKGKFTNWGIIEGYRDGHAVTAPVGRFDPSPYGLYDMGGNAWEWCGDWYGSYPSGPQTDPAGPATGSARVLRGGSWDYYPRCCRAALRLRNTPGDRWDNNGFRLVVLSGLGVGTP